MWRTHTHRQTDRQTDRHTTTAYTALSKASRGKNQRLSRTNLPGRAAIPKQIEISQFWFLIEWISVHCVQFGDIRWSNPRVYAVNNNTYELMGMIIPIFVWWSPKGRCYGNQLNLGDVLRGSAEWPLGLFFALAFDNRLADCQAAFKILHDTNPSWWTSERAILFVTHF